jgi:hypothetical protein
MEGPLPRPRGPSALQDLPHQVRGARIPRGGQTRSAATDVGRSRARAHHPGRLVGAVHDNGRPPASDVRLALRAGAGPHPGPLRPDATVAAGPLGHPSLAGLVEEIDPWYQAFVYTAAETGMRWSELVGLRRRGVDLLRRSVAVTEQMVLIWQKGKPSRWVRQKPKTKAGTRSISISTFLQTSVSAYLPACTMPAVGGNGGVSGRADGMGQVRSGVLREPAAGLVEPEGPLRVRLHFVYTRRCGLRGNDYRPGPPPRL